jgi:hypothetical protein
MDVVFRPRSRPAHRRDHQGATNRPHLRLLGLTAPTIISAEGRFLHRFAARSPVVCGREGPYSYELGADRAEQFHQRNSLPGCRWRSWRSSEGVASVPSGASRSRGFAVVPLRRLDISARSDTTSEVVLSEVWPGHLPPSGSARVPISRFTPPKRWRAPANRRGRSGAGAERRNDKLCRARVVRGRLGFRPVAPRV